MPIELVWDGTYKDGEKSSSLRINVPVQGVETGDEGGGKRQGMCDALADRTTAESASDVPQ